MALQISSIFDSRSYLAENLDVAVAASRGNLPGGPLQHFLRFGQFESRDPSSFFNTNFYLQRNADVRLAVNAGVFRSAFEHFIAAGQFEGRDPSTLFNSNFYLQRNPDVQQTVNNRSIRSALTHFIDFGQLEQRQPSIEFNPSFYLRQNPDVQAAVTVGTIGSAFQHFVQFGRSEGRPGGVGTVPGSFSLQLLHASDFEGGVSALDDAPRMSSVVNGLRSQFPNNTLFLSSGDNYIPGPFFAASSDPSLRPVLGREDIGRGDIIILNAMGVQASVFGNHEFDQGTRQVRTLIASDRGYPGTSFPYLSANLNFAPDANLRDLVVPDGQEASTIPNSIAKSTVITVNGERIGIVGATTPTLRSISAPGDVGVLPENPQDLDALAATIQPSVDALTGQGINKVILLAHLQQLDLELNLAPRLRDVDIIVAGGSHTLLSDSSDRLRAGDTSGGTYPLLRTSATGEPIVVVNTTSNYKYVGRLVTEFDAQGRVVTQSLNPDINGAYATDQQGVVATGNAAPNAKVVEVTQALRNVINTKDAQIFGRTSVYLNGERNSVRTEETNLGNLTADANLAAARAIDPSVVISLKNGGGIREAIGAIVGTGGNDPNAGQRIPPVANPAVGKEAGQISTLDIENSLRFNNQLTLLTLTAQQLQQVIEHGVADSAPGRTPGRFPQVGGIAFSFDPNRPAGNRVVSLAIKNANGITTDVVVQNGQLVGDPNRTFRTVTLNFLAGGGDGYPFPNFPAINQVETGIGEQTALANYLTQRFANTPFNVADVGVAQDTRIQNLSARTDTVISGTSAAQSLSNLQLFNDDFGVTDSSMSILAQSFTDPLSGILSSSSEVSMSNQPELVLNSNLSNMTETNLF
jgi:2',3'-cyclic-nucleotide 2'-phosphodiesterase (5'-nucleotidase family)